MPKQKQTTGNAPKISGVKEPKKPTFSLSESIKLAIRKRDADKGTGQTFRDSFGRRKAAM